MQILVKTVINDIEYNLPDNFKSSGSLGNYEATEINSLEDLQELIEGMVLDNNLKYINPILIPDNDCWELRFE